MIWNIVDHRTRKHRWLKVNAVIENTWHDNSCDDADQLETGEDGVQYDDRKDILLHDAVVWAEGVPAKVTLYLYDRGQGIR
ncbi:hypothetical protein [Nitratireductor sp. XY-223]|uniref:hypothetical protein n=1 Tax=Nitratireductor sp. XY-223 TaxID=2561926 RepID=UPI0010AA8370|nr:hypothetical protein [Nitratireductor sp. XY-223]